MYLFIHHCDLRIEDNTTLNHLWADNKQVVPIFIFTPEQIEDKQNQYRSSRAIGFMIQSLVDLEESYQKKDITLLFFLGNTLDVLEELLKRYGKDIEGVAQNMDYTPFARERDQGVQDYCDQKGKQYICLEDKLLQPISSILTKQGKSYRKFTPYFNTARAVAVRKPNTVSPIGFSTIITSSITLEKIQPYLSKDDHIIKGGRKEGMIRLSQIKKQSDYNHTRNIPKISTTRLSAYLKFGCLSIREVFHHTLDTLGEDTELLKQYYWRDFYSMILYYHPNHSEQVSITKPYLETIAWENDGDKFKKWCEGKTGCPIVDAGMREMNETGYMHNRVRMIVATFLIFYLKIDWRWGMKYFSRSLVDIDWASNVGNWQWTAGTEIWSNDYYKVFSMESQMKRFDPKGEYIQTWIKDLDEYNKIQPIIKDNKLARKEGIQLYKEAYSNK